MMGLNNPTVVASRTSTSTILYGDEWVQTFQGWNLPIMLVADARLESWSGRVAEQMTPQAFLNLPIDESLKTLETVNRVYQWFGEKRVTRDTVIVALGGGVLTDLVGYAAATYLRGIRWAAMPTTLLAQVDAAIGGKVGVNTAWGKNLIGAFHLPEAVAIDATFLSTLPLREWRAGLGEVMKSALIHGGSLYRQLRDLRLPEGDVGPEWSHVIHQTGRIKIALVNEDLYETGPRMFLNFGHTLGHALENVLGYGAMTHGEAVGLGCLAALALSEQRLGLSSTIRDEVVGWMHRWGLPVKFPSVAPARLWSSLNQDKKARASGLNWVLLQAPGEPRLVTGLTQDEVFDAIERLGQL